MALARQLCSQNRTILIAGNRRRLVFSSREKKRREYIDRVLESQTKRYGLLNGEFGREGFVRTKHEAKKKSN